MLVDWFTIAAQIVNFLILIWLLKHFLYGRIIKAMDQREERIASRIREAEQREKQAGQEAEEYKKKKEELETKKEEMLAQARKEAEQQRHELVERAREEVDRLKAQWRQAVQQEKGAFLADLRQRAGQEVFSVTRKALRDLADADLERHMVDALIKRITSLEPGDKQAIADVAKGDREIVVNSVFELPDNDKERLKDAIEAAVGRGLEVRFRTSEDMIMGIELRAQGHKIAWNLEEYLETLETRISHALQENSRGVPAGME
ncbi:MAG: ATP synthase subunit B [Candidatus Abyssubacteria bacterium]